MALSQPGTCPEPATEGFPARVRVEGKFFARGTRKVRFRGVTYGPFAPDVGGDPFPHPAQVAADFERMHAAGVNALRTYHAPPEWLLHLADDWHLSVLLDVPWPKHLCFLDDAGAQREARKLVRAAAERGRRHPSLLAYSIGNEIPPHVARWHGTRRIERFLAELMDVAKQADPEGLVTYANYPPTEYLDLSFLDFLTFNVYLHDREAFRRYLFRLQNLAGDQPLMLGEIGMDTFRNGELHQAEFLAGHAREATLMGLAGLFVFAWTDEWFTGGHLIQDWAFGVTHADRSPKASFHALREVFEQQPADLLPETPRVSVVVCTYNGGRTLWQCLRSLEALNYPNYEIVVVDDGSTDNTPAILAGFPNVRSIHQPNMGLSVARNVGLQETTGEIIAYTDSDCFADPDWLAHLVYQLQRSGADGVGGPNLSPEDGRIAACVGAAPGQPTHVLESDQVAEHVPGCNMAFRREALLAINGFDPQYTKAGDDVDLCWRLQQAGRWITFAPGAFVWHHRRHTPRAYLRQQAGYGEAEALLWFKHPDKFNARGEGKWRGVLYGGSLSGLRVGANIIYRGTFGSGLFQCVYQPIRQHWAMLPATLEWHIGLALLVLLSPIWPATGAAAGVLWGLSLLVAVLQALQARLPAEHDGFRSRCLIALLCYLQPLVRSGKRYRTRLFRHPVPAAGWELQGGMGPKRLPVGGALREAFWSETARDRLELLGEGVAHLDAHNWGRTIDSGWSDWDLEICCHAWTIVQVCTVQEDHPGGKRLLRVAYRVRPTGSLKVLTLATPVCGVLALVTPAGWAAAALAGFLGLFAVAVWWTGLRRATRVVTLFNRVAGRLDLIRCDQPVVVQRPEALAEQSSLNWTPTPAERAARAKESIAPDPRHTAVGAAESARPAQRVS